MGLQAKDAPPSTPVGRIGRRMSMMAGGGGSAQQAAAAAAAAAVEKPVLQPLQLGSDHQVIRQSGQSPPSNQKSRCGAFDSNSESLPTRHQLLHATR